MSQPVFETFFSDTPWIVCQWLMTDEQADANNGITKIRFVCAICGNSEEKEIHFPPDGDPIWDTIDPHQGLPEAHQIRTEYQLAHLHPAKHSAPMLDWAMPLLNPAALTSGIDLNQLTERLRRHIQGDRPTQSPDFPHN